MDPLTIILTIAGCIAGLFVLYVVVGLIVFSVASKKAKKTFDDFGRGFDSDFFKRNRGF